MTVANGYLSPRGAELRSKVNLWLVANTINIGPVTVLIVGVVSTFAWIGISKKRPHALAQQLLLKPPVRKAPYCDGNFRNR